MGVICVECGKSITRIQGSLKHPYCLKCFQKVWDYNYALYMEWLDKYHYTKNPKEFIKENYAKRME